MDLFYTFGSVSGDVIAGGSSEVDQINCGLLPFGPPSCAFTASPIGSIDYDSHELRVVYDDNESWRFEFGGFASDGEDIFETLFASAPVLIEGVTDPATVAPVTDFFGAPAASDLTETCLLYTSPSPRDRTRYRMPSSA